MQKEMTLNLQKNKKKGFTLIETIVAIFVITVGIMGIISLIYMTIVMTSFSSNRLIAAYLAQEGSEIVRNIRDTNFLESTPWDDGFAACNTGCEADYGDASLTSYADRFLKINGDFYNYDSGTTNTIFKRKITITPLTADQINVKVEVLWIERNRPYSLSAQEDLYNWR